MKKTSIHEEKAELRPTYAHMLPLGTLVRAGDESGIIVGAFQGASEVVYVFLKADGEVDCDYGSSVKTAPESAGGLPPVIDLEGRDPLEKLREVVGLPLSPGERQLASKEHRFRFALIMALGGPSEQGWDDDRIVNRVRELRGNVRIYAQAMAGAGGKQVAAREPLRRVLKSRRRRAAKTAA